MIFLIVFGSLADFNSAFSFSDTDLFSKGVIVAKQATNSSENKHKIYKYTYQYNLDGRAYSGDSFSTSQETNTGDTVKIRYIAKKPELSRIEGMRSAPFDIWVIPLAAIFPLIGLIFIILSMRRALKNIHLVQNGILTYGKVIRTEATKSTVNNKRIYKVFFQFKSHDGNLHEAFNKTHQTYNLGDEEKEPLVYDAQNPSKAILLDTLPVKIRAIVTS